MRKCLLYIVDNATHDNVETQRKGMVWLSEPNGMSFQIAKGFPTLKEMPRSLPVRLVAGHHFFHNSVTYQLMEKYIMALHTMGFLSERVIRHKFYVGFTKLEMKYRLMGFGIPIEYMPWTDTGKIKLKYWTPWLKSALMIESVGTAERKDLEMVECPGTDDVVFRHGCTYKKLNGNSTMQDWIETELVSRKLSGSTLQPGSDNNETVSQYARDRNNNNNSIDKFCDRLIHHIEHNQKGRFLKWDNKLNVWIWIRNGVEIKKKVIAFFYNYNQRSFDTQRITQKKTITTTTTTADDLSGMNKFIDGGKPINNTDLCRCFDPAESIEGKRRRTATPW